MKDYGLHEDICRLLRLHEAKIKDAESEQTTTMAIIREEGARNKTTEAIIALFDDRTRRGTL